MTLLLSLFNGSEPLNNKENVFIWIVEDVVAEAAGLVLLNEGG